MKTIDALTPGGSTPGESGIRLAYNVARNHFIKGGSNRVILATDGDFNVGLRTEDELNEMIAQQRESGIYLTCLGVGMGNYKDSKIQTLARRGNGNFAYIDNFREGEKVLMKEFTGTLYAVADDVYMDVEFNPQYVKDYRLIGYDNKVGAITDSLSRIEGGEIGSGQSLLTLFEISPEPSSRELPGTGIGGKFAEVRIDYKHSNDSTNCHFQQSGKWEVIPFEKIDRYYKFSASVALFGSLLRYSPYIRNISWNELIAWATESADQGDILQKEFLSIIQQAKTLYSKLKKRKKEREG
jgi:Ca-activated chloride channel family protein